MSTITDEQLVATLTQAIAAANAAAASANAAAANANQASSGAAAGVAGARTQSNAENASLNDAILKTVSQQTESDINVPEAWQANVKRTYDIHQSMDSEFAQRNRVHFDQMVSQLQTHLANINQLTLQSLANNQNQSNLVNTQAITHNALAVDRQWNINETDLAAKSAAIYTDAIAAGVAKIASSVGVKAD